MTAFAKKNDYHFDIHPSIVFQLGESLISDAVQALVELIKNAYDADADYVKVKVETTGKNDVKESRYPGAPNAPTLTWDSNFIDYYGVNVVVDELQPSSR